MGEAPTNDQKLILKLTEIVLSRLYDKDFGVSQLVAESGLSRTGLNRKLRKILNKSINQFIRETRLQKALEILRNEDLTAAEVSYMVGFSSPAYFNTCFHEYFGFPPGRAKHDYINSSPAEDSRSIPILNQPKPGDKRYQKAGFLAISIIIVTGCILVIQFIFGKGTPDDLRSSDGRISIAVMPFTNKSDARILDEIQNNIISYLSNFEEFEVRHKEAVGIIPESRGVTDYASLSASLARIISRKLDVRVFICGDISQAGSVVRINANLINSKTNVVIRSFQVEGAAIGEEIFELIDTVSVMSSRFLLKSKMEKEVSFDVKPYRYTNSPEAFQLVAEADEALKRYDSSTALKLYYQAVSIDSNYIPAIIFLSMRYKEMGNYDEAKKWCLKAYSKRDRMHKTERILADWYYAKLFGSPYDEIKYLKQYQEADDQVPICYFMTGTAYNRLFQYDKAIPELEKALEIYRKWGVKPMMSQFYSQLGYSYHNTGHFKKERRLYRKAMVDFPDDHYIIRQYAILSFAKGDTINGNRYIKQYKTVLKELALPETTILSMEAAIFTEANLLSRATECYNEALSLDPDNIMLVNDLAYLLVDKELDINKGLDLVDTALKSNPGNINLLHTRGWALYKLGKPDIALAILEECWDLKPVYERTLFLHLNEVQNSLSGQNKVNTAKIL